MGYLNNNLKILFNPLSTKVGFILFFQPALGFHVKVILVAVQPPKGFYTNMNVPPFVCAKIHFFYFFLKI